ncbi:MAG: hypothetical protein AAGA31_10770 [Bacteroidota bacterium]
MSTTTNVGSTAQVRGHIFSIYGITTLLANAILTAMFGFTFLHGVFGAILLILFFDAAAVSWFVVRLGKGLSGAQRAIAKMMSVITIVGSTLVSVVQVLTMTQVMGAGEWIHVSAVWLVTVYGAANFFAIFYFQNRSVMERETELNEEIAAQKADKMHEMTHEAHVKAMEKANALLMHRTDVIAQRIAKDAERDYLRAMDCLDLLDSPTPEVDNKGAAAGAVSGNQIGMTAFQVDCIQGKHPGTTAFEISELYEDFKSADTDLDFIDYAGKILVDRDIDRKNRLAAAKEEEELSSIGLQEAHDMEPLDLTIASGPAPTDTTPPPSGN